LNNINTWFNEKKMVFLKMKIKALAQYLIFFQLYALPSLEKCQKHIDINPLISSQKFSLHLSPSILKRAFQR